MKELSLNILDIAENSVRAEATEIGITITEAAGIRELTIEDNGCGMPEEMVRTVTDPFTTSRNTRKVGMGIPLLKLAAEQTGGTFEISSTQDAETHGTRVHALFHTEHIDCVPVGDYASTMTTLLQGNPSIDFRFLYRTEDGEKELDTREMREILGPDVSLDNPSVLVWVSEMLREPFEKE